MNDTIEIARRAFEDITSTFPNLAWHFSEDEPVELSMDIPKQEGLDFDINLNLQNGDELHFSVSHFWCEWFPCTSPDEVEDYKRAVIGFIAGDYRVLEHFRGRRAVKAELQAPENGSWVTLATCSTPSRPFPWKKTHLPWKKTHRVIQNAQQT